MGRTFCSDRGGVMRGHNEELTRWRWARKRFDVPAGAVDQPADVWLLAASYAKTRVPLNVTLNGQAVPGGKLSGHWLEYDVDPAAVRQGWNEFGFRLNPGTMTPATLRDLHLWVRREKG